MSGTVLLTVPQVMARPQVSRHTVYELIRNRELRSVTIGRSRRIPAAALESYVQSRQQMAGVGGGR